MGLYGVDTTFSKQFGRKPPKPIANTKPSLASQPKTGVEKPAPIASVGQAENATALSENIADGEQLTVHTKAGNATPYWDAMFERIQGYFKWSIIPGSLAAGTAYAVGGKRGLPVIMALGAARHTYTIDDFPRVKAVSDMAMVPLNYDFGKARNKTGEILVYLDPTNNASLPRQAIALMDPSDPSSLPAKAKETAAATQEALTSAVSDAASGVGGAISGGISKASGAITNEVGELGTYVLYGIGALVTLRVLKLI